MMVCASVGILYIEEAGQAIVEYMHAEAEKQRSEE